jgi:hypothetical protein
LVQWQNNCSNLSPISQYQQQHHATSNILFRISFHNVLASKKQNWLSWNNVDFLKLYYIHPPSPLFILLLEEKPVISYFSKEKLKIATGK